MRQGVLEINFIWLGWCWFCGLSGLPYHNISINVCGFHSSMQYILKNEIENNTYMSKYNMEFRQINNIC